MEFAAENRKLKRKLVNKGQSHGILIYLKGEPVGWCQYGLTAELPHFDSTWDDRKIVRGSIPQNKWRITCFTVERKFRRLGVASIALDAALKSIRKKGGGLVEAYPIHRWGAYRGHLGIASMFENEGFKRVTPFGKRNVVMQKTV